ncbi:MAG: hypothetical protein IPO95_14725 [Rhodanobacteraceae bacterium]|nr:hypothetical protein [Rhodanobacteraceae bacterium]MBL0041552.1 hypothetical protein [Xanthomonadales bacterium]
MKHSLRVGLWVLSALLADGAVAQTLHFAGIDVHGSSVPVATLLRGVTMPKVGQAIAPDSGVPDAVCSRVREQLDGERFLSVNCIAVGDPGGTVHLVIDVVEPADAERISYPAIQYVDHLRLSERGGERRSEELIACARGCSQAADRADSLDFLDRLDWGKTSCRAALQALDDRDWTVRHQAARLLKRHLDACVDALGRARIVDAVLRQLTRPTHVDRARAMATLDPLVRRGFDIDAGRQARIVTALETLARVSHLPDVGGTASALLEHLRRPAKPGDADLER